MAFDQTSLPEDAQLLLRYAEGDMKAATLLTERLAPRLLRFATRMLGDRAEAEDAVQDAMMRLWKMAPDWQQQNAQVSTWAYRVLRNLCIDRLRKSQRMEYEEFSDPEDERPGIEMQMMQQSRMDALDTALNALPDRQKQAVVLRHIEGLSNPEIAQVMEISIEAVESLTARGKRALAQLMIGRKEELGL